MKIINPQALELYDRLIAEEAAATRLFMMGSYHPETLNHMLRVCKLSIDMGYDNGVGDSMHDLSYGALLHDIRKYKIPLSILNKKYPNLTPRQREIMKVHVEGISDELLGFPKPMIYIVKNHHALKRKDPYPKERKVIKEWEDLVEIVSTADVYDALTSGRRYNRSREPLSEMDIRKILESELNVEKIYIDQVLRRHVQP